MWTCRRFTNDASLPSQTAGLETKGHTGPANIARKRTVLQMLAGGDCWLAREVLSSGPRWTIFAAAGGGARQLRQLPDPLVEELRRTGLIESTDDGASMRWRISAAGRRWLARQVPAMATKQQPAAQGDDGKKPDARRRAEETRRRNGQRKPRQDNQREVCRMLIREAETGTLREVAVNMKESPLMWLARRRDANGRPYLEPHHVAAGERLRVDYETACMQPQITASWNPALVAADRGRLKSGPRDPFPFAERVMLARQRVHRALESIGTELADIAVAVCCLGNGIEAAERTLNWPRRSARLVLRIALERLADHYGLKAPREQAAPGWRKALGWHAEGGRPTQLMPADADNANKHNAADGKE